MQDNPLAQVALEALYEFCNRTNRKRRPRRESPDFKVVEKVMEWWLGDEWRQSTLDQQERHLRSATQWANQRVKRNRHRLVDDALLQSRLGCLLQMTSTGCSAGSSMAMPAPARHHPHANGSASSAVPQFRGSAREWAAQLGISSDQQLPAVSMYQGDGHTHSLNCGHTPVKVISTEGTTSLGFVMRRASCCAMSGNLICDAHAGQQSKSTGNAAAGVHGAYPDLPMYSTVSHGDHIDFVIDGHLRHPERTNDGELKWEDCGELIELDEETIADMYDLLL